MLLLFQHADLLLEIFIILFGTWMFDYLLRKSKKNNPVWLYIIPVFFILIGSAVLLSSLAGLFNKL